MAVTTPNIYAVNNHQNYLVINLISADGHSIIPCITKELTKYSCNIVSSRMTYLGSEFSIIMLVEGSWNAIAKLEAILSNLEKKLETVSINFRRTSKIQKQDPFLVYQVHAITADKLGIIEGISNFFLNNAVIISDICSNCHITSSGTKISNIFITVNIPLSVHIPSLRDDFSIYCDKQNLDAGFEPLREII